MEYKEFKEMFYEELQKNNIRECDTIEKFYQYMKLLLEWNKKINLTAIKDEKEFIVKHFIDSLTISPYFMGREKVIDIGTGAGFPGIPIKLFHEELSVTLVDSVSKKISVLNDIIAQLNLKNIQAIHVRAEDFAKENREKYDIAVSRAVASMNTLVEYLIPFVKIGGSIICMKGPNYEEEIEEAKSNIKKFGGKIEKIENIIIDGEYERNIILIRKV